MSSGKEDTNMLDQTDYILCKCDTNFALTYVNSTFRNITDWDFGETMGKELYFLHHPDVPKSFNQFIAFKLKSQGFFNGFVRCINKRQQSFWLFIDFGKRYTKEGVFLGYEYMGYKPSEEGVVYFENLSGELLEIEQRYPGDSGVSQAYDHFLQHIDSMDVDYDEFVCTVQKTQ